mgnify:CR=1 FL=1
MFRSQPEEIAQFKDDDQSARNHDQCKHPQFALPEVHDVAGVGQGKSYFAHHIICRYRRGVVNIVGIAFGDETGAALVLAFRRIYLHNTVRGEGGSAAAGAVKGDDVSHPDDTRIDGLDKGQAARLKSRAHTAAEHDVHLMAGHLGRAAPDPALHHGKN